MASNFLEKKAAEKRKHLEEKYGNKDVEKYYGESSDESTEQNVNVGRASGFLQKRANEAQRRAIQSVATWEQKFAPFAKPLPKLATAPNYDPVVAYDSAIKPVNEKVKKLQQKQKGVEVALENAHQNPDLYSDDKAKRDAAKRAVSDLETKHKAYFGEIAKAQDTRDSLLEQNKKQYQQAKRDKKNEYFLSIKRTPGFSENSEYRSTETGEGAKINPLVDGVEYYETGFDDIIYDVINKNQTAIDRLRTNENSNGYTTTGHDLVPVYAQMRPDEIAVFNAWYKVDKNKAYEYVNNLMPELNERRSEAERAYWLKSAQESPVGNSLFSLSLAPLKGIGYLGQAMDLLDGKELDPNAGYNRYSNISSDIREQVSKDVEKNWGAVGSYTYNLGMSMGDFLVSTAIGGGNSAFSLSIMGTGAAADTTIDAKRRGLSDGRAFALGTIAGAAEVFTERMALDELFDVAKLGKGAVLSYIATNAATEGIEEGTSNVINTIADILISQDKSEWQRALSYYNQQGKDDGEAFYLALMDKAEELGLDVLGGIISGGVISSVAAGGSEVNAYTTGREINAGKDAQTRILEMIDAGKASPLDTQAYVQAERAQTQLDESGKVKNSTLGRLAQGNEIVLQEQAEAYAKEISNGKRPSKDALAYAHSAVETAEDVRGGHESLRELIAEGKALTPTAARVAAAVEQKLDAGEDISRADIIGLIKANDNAVKRIGAEPMQGSQVKRTTQIELTPAQEKESRFVQERYGYGENGARQFVDLASGEANLYDLHLDFQVPYEAGRMNQTRDTVQLDSPIAVMAYNAGQLDYMATRPKTQATSGTAAPASTAVTVQSVAERLMDAGTGAETATVLANDLHTLATEPNMLRPAAQNRIRSNPVARQIEYELREQVITFADQSTDSTVEETADLGYNENRMLGDLNDEGAIDYETRLAEARGRTQEGDAGTRAETDERPRVSEKIGRKQGAAQEDYLGLREKGIIESDAAEYGVPLNFVAPENWPDKHKGVPAFARGGQIFVIADSTAAEIANGLVPHEVAHVMRQLRFGAYLNLLDRVPDMINRTNDSGWDLLRGAAAHRGIDLFGGATAEQVEGVYDEIIALVSSVATKDIDGHMLKNLREAFYDYDAFKAELKAVHQQFKNRNQAQPSETTVSERDDSPIMADRSGKQKNTTEKSGGKKYSLRAYSERQIENWKSSPKIVVYDGPESLKHFVNKAINDGQFNGKMYFGIVDGDLAGAIRMQTGLTLAGRNVTLRAGNVRKILKSHGNEQTESAREQRAITVRDFALIPEVIAEPDGIFRENGEEYRGKPALLFKKTVAGSEVTILAVDSGGSLDLFVQTMYASKKKESIANVTDEKTPIITSETSVGTAPTRSIPQKRELVNGKTSANDDGVQHETATATATKVKNERWDAERVGDPNVAPKSLSEIVEGIRHDFGINITKGHIRGKGVRGQYNTRNHGIRSRVVNNLPTIAHELGHHLDTVYRMTSGLSRAEIAELHGGLSDATKEAYAQNKWTAEGIAEYLRRYLQNSDEAALAYPAFTKYFKNTLSEKDLALIERLADDVNAYYALDADAATSTIRLQEESGYDARTAIEKLKDKAKVLYAAWFDSNRGIREFDKATGANTYKLATNSAYADAIAGQIVVGDLTDVNGQYVAPGLKTLLSGLDLNDVTEYRLFGEYLTVKHGPERLAEGMRIFADDRKNTVEFMQRRLATLERQFPQFAEISERLYEFQKQFLQTWGVETGLVSRKASLDWADRWAYYVPLNRAVSMEKRGIGARRGYANQNSTIKQARGSGLDIVHPVDNIINNIVKMVNAGVRNNVMRAITKADTDALFLEKVPTPMVRKGFDMTGVKDDLLSMLEESGMNDNEQKKAQQIITTLDDVLFQYSRGKAFGDVVTVMKDGKPEFWKINDPLLLESVTNMRPKTLEGVLGVLASINRFMTGNITGSNIVWSLFSNAPRDIMTFFTYSKNRNPVKAFSAMGSAYLNKMRDDTHRDPLYLEYLAMGGGHSSMYTADRNMVKDARKKLRGRNLRKVRDWASPMECVSWISDAIESGPRFAAYKLARQSGLSPQEAFYEAMDVTVNFRRGGRLARQVNYFVPFFNAGVQGQDKFRRWITASDAPAVDRAKVCAKRTVAWLGVNAAVAILVYALNHMDGEKEKDYEQLSNHTKNSYWCIPLGDGKYFAITKNRELATPSSLFERVMEYSLADNKHAFDGFYEYATNQWLPNVLSDLAQGDVYGAIGSLGIVGTGSYMMANRDFLGRPIVSQSMMNLEPKDQYTKRTTQVAYWIGQAFDVSPIQVDFLLDSTLGGFQDANAALFPVDGNERDWSLGVRNTYIKDNQYSTDLSNWIYDKAEASKIAYNSDQTDMAKAITYKMDSNMTTFYSNYNKLAKGSSDTRQSRITRQAVFDMLSGYQKAADSGYTTKAQRAVYNACKTHGKTELLPSVMNPVVRDGNNKQHTLSATQYVEYQTDYNRLYWEYVEENMSVTTAQTKKVAILKAAKDVASEKAKNRVLARIGAPQTAFETKYSGVEDRDVVYFRAALDLADEDGGLKQEEVKTIIAEMVRDGLEKEDAYTLFHSKYESDKNNPWRRYQ